MGDVEHQRALPHARSGGENDQIRALQATCQPIEIDVAGRDSGNRALVIVDHVHLFVDKSEDPGEWLKIARNAKARNIEERLLGLFERVLGIEPLIVAERSNPPTGVY